MTKSLTITVSPQERVRIADQDMHVLFEWHVSDVESFHNDIHHVILSSHGHTYIVAVAVAMRPAHLKYLAEVTP